MLLDPHVLDGVAKSFDGSEMAANYIPVQVYATYDDWSSARHASR